MGKKYIIEIPEDKITDFVGSTHFLMPYMMAGHIGHHDTGLPIEPYTEPDLEQVRRDYDAYYEKGLDDAWEAARKISLAKIDGGFSWESMNNMFGTDSPSKIYKTFTASEAIEKIRQYEQEKEGKEEQIQVGDEVTLKCGVRPAIYMQGTKGSDEIYLLFNDGSCGLHSKSEIERKTGRHFPEIATILEKMRGEQDG